MAHYSWSETPCTADSDANTSQHREFTTTSEAYGHDIYRGLVDDEKVDAFLSTTKTFDFVNKQWFLPQASLIAENLVTSAFRTVRTILLRFVGPTQPGVEREVRNMLKPNANHPKNEDGYDICPTLVIRASGPSFESPVPIPHTDSATARPKVAFINIASFITVKFESQVGNLKEVLKEMESHARELFRYQPNRQYVRSILLTEKHARLVHFDRAGIQTTPPIDIHQNPATFVRLVLGISSTNERFLGLDDSVQWNIVDGQKGTGTITTTDANGVAKTYTIIERLPVPRDAIQGRGTTCWRVEDPETSEIYVVKDSWRPEGCSPEHEFLEYARDIPGVAHMVSYESGHRATRELRCPTTAGQYHNRFAMRIVSKSYGRPIVFFACILQVICAIRDAIAGHQRLSEDGIGILHRDISHNNILLGSDGALDGDRGVLIDLEMAFRHTEANPGVKVNHTIGTRLFQSISVLDSFSPMGFIPDHDYLDDLESFFYVLSYVLLLFRSDGSLLPGQDEGPSIARAWGLDDPDMAVNNKCSFYGPGSTGLAALRIIQGTWHPACVALFKGFRNFITRVTEKKARLMHGAEEDASQDLLEPLLSGRDEHYALVLGMFDKAIDALRGTATTANPPQSATGSAVGIDAEARPSNARSPFPTPIGRPRSPPNSPEAESSTAATPAPTADAAPPAAIPPPPPSVATLRRSTRIRKLRAGPTEKPTPLTTLTPDPTIEPPRRSSRIQKRRRDEDESPPVPPSKTRRIAKGLRSATRAR